MLSSEIFCLETLSDALQSGTTTAVELTESMLANIANPAGQGSAVFTRVFRDEALAQAEASDALRRVGASRSRIDGIPISVKDLFDVRGYTTRAGSKVLQNHAPATEDAVVIQRLRQAGCVIVGTTNMTEFAYSGLGLNPHYGTALCAWDRETGRIPGGSSSGAAVSVTDQMAVAAVGTDTGGSVRIPAAFCGLVGYKPTASLIDMTGTLPLSTHLDSIGPLANTVTSCAWLADVLAGRPIGSVELIDALGLRLAVPNQLVFEGADDCVLHTFTLACESLERAGMEVLSIDLPELDEIAGLNAAGGFTAAEAWGWHRQLLQTREVDYDPRVSSRIKRGADLSAKYLIDLIAAREDWIARVQRKLTFVDALIMPTVPIVAPELQPLIDDDALYAKTNLLALRNPTIVNFLNGCAVSLPCHQLGGAPVGLMLAMRGGQDRQLLRLARTCEVALDRRGDPA